MLQSMRQIALDMLHGSLYDASQAESDEWYRRLRAEDPGRLFRWLVEDSEKIEKYYTLRADPKDSAQAIMEVHDFKDGDAVKLPFNQPSGSQSAALGPIIKRSWKVRDKEAGPTEKIQNTTLNAFDRLAKDTRAWSGYFREVLGTVERRRIFCAWNGETREGHNALSLAVSNIPEKKTVLLAFLDSRGRLPGEVPEYVEYLQAILMEAKYATAKAPAIHGLNCSMCGEQAIVYSNALSGAGINFSNMDRVGAFPGIDAAAAWKRYPLCGSCADLLYIYKNHIARDFYCTVAGEKALIVPVTQGEPLFRQKFLKRVRELAAGVEKDEAGAREERLIRLLGEERAVSSLSFLWATFGQNIDEIRGILTDVLPSRLRRLDGLSAKIRALAQPLFPLKDLENFTYDLRLSILESILKRPGGRKVEYANKSKQLFDFRRELVEAIYHGRDFGQKRLWDELLLTARYHWDDALQQDKPGWGMLHEGFSEKKQKRFLTLAGWVRQVARFLHYLRMTGVMPMSSDPYKPRCEKLKRFFTEESALDSPEKAFAFILGALYGKVIQVQAARDVNVGANALTWLKRLTLTGNDLPHLYIKVREKLLAYETESSLVVRELVTELGELGLRLGDRISLSEVQTCYFLLLGQSLATTIMPAKESE